MFKSGCTTPPAMTLGRLPDCSVLPFPDILSEGNDYYSPHRVWLEDGVNTCQVLTPK